MYAKRTNIPEQWTCELLPPLDDEPSKQSLKDWLLLQIIKLLYNVYELNTLRKGSGNSSFGVEFRSPMSSLLSLWEHFVFWLIRFIYLKWPAQQSRELLRNQFIHGIRSSAIQLKLMKDMPGTIDEALQLASQQQTVEEAQKRLQKDKLYVDSLAIADQSRRDAIIHEQDCVIRIGSQDS